MRVIDLDAIDWTKAPVEFADYVSIEAMKQWLSAQEGPVVMVLTNSKNPLLRSVPAVHQHRQADRHPERTERNGGTK